MKFSITKVRNGGCRLGVITEAGLQGDKVFTTPMCMVYTKKGSAPYLTQDMLSHISSLPSCAHLPLNLLLEHKNQLSQYNKGLGHFTALQSHLVYASLHDPAIVLPPGYNGKKNVAVWGKGGKIALLSKDYMEMIESCQPDWFHALADGDANETTAKKKLRRLVDKTLTFLDECLEFQKGSKSLLQSAMFGVLVGGFDVEERCRSACETAQRPVAGFVVDGFHHNGPDTETFDMSSVKHILNKMWECLPPERPRLMCHVWTPLSVLEGVECGVDIFDSSYPYVVTERNAALVFNYAINKKSEVEATHKDRSYEIDFTDDRYCDDFSPIMPSCSCFTCTHHTRAYLHHLVKTSELLAGVLLMLHNFHHYFGFFEAIRKSLQDNNFDELKHMISSATQR